jgi:putative transposase
MEEKEKPDGFSFEEFEKEAIKGLYERKSLSGENGVFAPLLKHFLEKALALELEQHLKDSEGNKRNGVTTKTVKSSNGAFELSTPRDREGTFTPEIVAKRQVVLDDELCEKILSLYAKGMSYADIRKMLMEVYGLSLSPAQMSEITDRLIPELQEWQQRPLHSLYAMVWFDAIHFKCRDNGSVQSKALYNVYAVNQDGFRELLGIYIAQSESARFWLEVLQDLHLRGVQDILIACTDNLKGFSDAISSCFPDTVVQSCIVHQVRNTLKYAASKDYTPITADMRAIYSSPTLEAAEQELERFAQRWEKKYPTAVKSWQENWYKLSSFFDFGREIRRLMYTTNPIESIHRRMRKVTKTKGCFPSEMAIKKLIFLVIRDINACPKREISGWRLVYGQLRIKFAERMAKYGA